MLKPRYGPLVLAVLIGSPSASAQTWVTTTEDYVTDQLLQRAYGGPEGADRALGLVAARDGGYLLVGETLSWGRPGSRMLAVRVDRAGNLEWAGAFGSQGPADALHSGVHHPSGDFLVAGTSGSILRLGPGGDLVWSRNYGLTEIREIAPTSDGNFVIAGWRAVGDQDAAELVMIDPAGEILWRASYGQSGVTYRFFAVHPLDDGGYLAGGEINGPDFADFSGWIIRLSPLGDIVWQRHLNDGGGEVHSLAPARDGSILVGGHRQSFPQMTVVRVDGMGQVAGCAHSVTQALRLPYSGGWTAGTTNVIEPTTLAVTETDKPVEDAFAPEDRLVCQGGQTYPPSEVSPPAASDSPLRFEDERTLIWEDGAPSASTGFDLHRGELAELRSGTGPGCLFGGLALNTASDGDTPTPGAAFTYLVAGRNGAGIGPLGRSSDGAERAPAAACDGSAALRLPDS